jgi:AAA domain
MACHLASGVDWLGVKVPRPIRVLMIEREGARPLLRDKLRRKLAAWQQSGRAPINGRVRMWEQAWGEFTFASDEWRDELARIITEQEVDLVIVGPLTRIGMDGPGTLHEVIAFTELMNDVRRRCDRRVAITIVHHENKSGAVSGAWEGAGDTLLHVQLAGHGHTVVYIQKARWGSDLHGTTMHLAWTDGEGFEREDERDLIAEAREKLAGFWTINEARKVLEVGKETIRQLIDDHPDDFFGPVTGEDAKKLNRSSNAILYSVKPCLD